MRAKPPFLHENLPIPHDSCDIFEHPRSLLGRLRYHGHNVSRQPDSPPQPAPRDPVFDIAKGLGILAVIGIHSFNNSSRLYTNPHSAQWWALTLVNRLCGFAVPLFLLISAILSARSLQSKPQLPPFYRKRLIGVLWPYIVWSAVYWCAKMAQDPASRKIVPASLFGLRYSGPAELTHVKDRLLELVWGKAFFHLYFLLVLAELLVLLPLAVAAINRFKPGFYVTLAAAFGLQILILIGQHETAILKYPASTALWYLGSLLPGAWIGLNWSTFKTLPKHVPVVLSLLTAIGFPIYFGCQFGSQVGIHIPEFAENFALTLFASCASILVLLLSFPIAKHPKLGNPIQFLGKNSLQVYLIHPMVMFYLASPSVVHLLNPTCLGPLISPILMLTVTFGVIGALRVLRLEKAMFGR